MSPSLFLLLLVCLANGPTLGRGQRRHVITLMPDEGQLLVLKEIRKGQEFWLYPNAAVESAQLCSRCPRKGAVTLSIRFWQKSRLTLARSLLMAQGWCRKGDPCRVSPFLAKKILLRDSYQQWETPTSSVPLPGVLPPTKRITILPKRGFNSSSLTPEALTDFQISFVTSTAVRGERRRLTITGEDLLLAQRILKLPDSRLTDGASLKKLSTWLLKAKTQHVSAEQLPTLLASLERQLTVTSMFFRPGMENLLPKGYRAKDGEQLFALRGISAKEKIDISFGPSASCDSFKFPKTLTSGLRISETFKFYAMPTKASVEEPAGILKRLDERMTLMLREMNKSKSQRQTLAKRADKAESQRRNLQEDVQILTKQLNQTETQRQILQEEVTRLKKALNVTNSGSNVVLLERQMKKLAAVCNSSHIMSIDTMDLTAVGDCFEVKQKRLMAGVYFVRSLRAAAECTEEGDLVALKRRHGDVDFNASWSQFEEGLGDVRKSDYFIGLRNLSAITQKNDICMTLQLTPWKLRTPVKSATYDTFRVGPKEDNYRLSYENYTGNLVFDVLSVMNGQRFSTYDVDNDNFVGSCAKRYRSGNWHNSCLKCNLFGPKTNDASSGMCCTGLVSSQGDMCSPLASVRLLLRSKANAGGSRRVIFSHISSSYRGGSCAKLRFFTVPASGLHTVTVGGASGGFDSEADSQPGGRGATLKAQFFFRKGTRLAAVAGCPGYSTKGGGDASWLISRSRKMLLAVAGGGGASGEKGSYYSYFPGLHGRATPDGGDGWWNAHSDSPSARSILLLDKVGVRAKGWADLRNRLLTASSGDFQSGAAGCSKYGGGGGGGYEGGIGCPTNNYDAGGGGGSLCSAAEAASCHITEGGNTRRSGFVIIERHMCL